MKLFNKHDGRNRLSISKPTEDWKEFANYLKVIAKKYNLTAEDVEPIIQFEHMINNHGLHEYRLEQMIKRAENENQSDL